MKGLLTLFAGSVLFFGASVAIADDAPTSMATNWTCTTNASSSSVAADQAADKEMDEVKKSAADAYAFAAQHCRDCTKITCEFDD